MIGASVLVVIALLSLIEGRMKITAVAITWPKPTSDLNIQRYVPLIEKRVFPTVFKSLRVGAPGRKFSSIDIKETFDAENDQQMLIRIYMKNEADVVTNSTLKYLKQDLERVSFHEQIDVFGQNYVSRGLSSGDIFEYSGEGVR